MVMKRELQFGSEVEMDTQKHKKRHQELHSELDELVADFLSQNEGKLPSKTTILELIEWSYGQTETPTLRTGWDDGK